jgi:hypothetical protein
MGNNNISAGWNYSLPRLLQSWPASLQQTFNLAPGASRNSLGQEWTFKPIIQSNNQWPDLTEFDFNQLGSPRTGIASIFYLNAARGDNNACW